MKKINILKENKDFERIIHTARYQKNNSYVIYKENSQDPIYHFGISVSKKIGNAVTRNKIKRQIKNILDEKNYQNNMNCIIIVRKGILNRSFNEKREDLFSLLSKGQIIKGEKNEKKDM